MKKKLGKIKEKRAYLKGRFQPTNINKYTGDPKNIIFRSSYELKFMKYCDTNSSILEWSSETIIVPYKSPLDGKFHRYFTDFKIKVIDKNGVVNTHIIEIKPRVQTREPKPKARMTKRYLREISTWVINRAKWDAAEEYCKKRGWKFLILTEKELNIRN